MRVIGSMGLPRKLPVEEEDLLELEEGGELAIVMNFRADERASHIDRDDEMVSCLSELIPAHVALM